jgi:hypothetical protein
MAMVFEDFSVGQETRTPGRTVTEADVVAFAGRPGLQPDPYQCRVRLGDALR